MRLAVVGKGGAGKSVIAGTLARLLGRESAGVLAVDLDPNPGLAFSLGIPLTDAGLPDEAVEAAEAAAYGHRLRRGLSAEEAVDRFAVPGPDGVRFLQIGKMDRADHQVARSVVAVRAILRGFRRPGWHVVADFEAGPTTPFEGYADFADAALLVAEPSAASFAAARRVASILRAQKLPYHLLGNQARDGDAAAELRELADELEVRLETVIPYDPEVMDAERVGEAPLDRCPGAPAMEAIGRLVAMLPEMAAAS